MDVLKNALNIVEEFNQRAEEQGRWTLLFLEVTNRYARIAWGGITIWDTEDDNDSTPGWASPEAIRAYVLAELAEIRDSLNRGLTLILEDDVEQGQVWWIEERRLCPACGSDRESHYQEKKDE